jgi:hypothetical protein
MKSGDLMGSWKSMPYLMLEKCAVANVMRWAFPEALTGLYVAEEIDKDVPPPPKPVQAPRVEISAPQPISVEQSASLEQVRSDVLDFLNTRQDEWFVKLGKLKANLVQVIENEKTLDGMLFLQGKTEEYERKYQEMVGRDELRKQQPV